MQWRQSCLAGMEEAGRKVKAIYKAILAFIAKHISFEVVQQTDLWSVYWGLRLDVGKYSIYLGGAKDRA